jgi:pimeloyl-ACP methyl ester carboxylesterase
MTREPSPSPLNAGTRLPGTPEPMHYWTGVAGNRIAGDFWGPPEGPLVLLQHGGGQTRHAWKRVGVALGTAGYRTISFDARGHGDSDWAADGNYGQSAMVGDLECVIAQLGKRRPVLVGASMGGGTSLVAVGEDRVDATALVLVDIAPKIETEGVAKIEAFMARNPEGFESLQEVADAIASYQPHRKPSGSLAGLVKNVRLGQDGKYHWHWDPRFRTARRSLELRQKRFEQCAARLTLPTLLVRGGLSDVLSEEGAQEFLRLAPHSEYVNVLGAAHMVAGDRNDHFGQAVIEFLTRKVPVGKEPMHAPHDLGEQRAASPLDINDVP